MENIDFLNLDAEKVMVAWKVRLDGINCSSGLRGVSVSLMGDERRYIGRSENRGSLSLALDEAFQDALCQAKVCHIDRHCYPHHTLLLNL